MIEPAVTDMTVQQAVKAAVDFFAEQYKEHGFEDVLLEEVVWAEGAWEITIGYSRRNRNGSPLPPALGGQSQWVREYKTITVDARSGRVESMKIRKV